MLFNPRTHARIFEFDFLKVGDTVRYIIDDDDTGQEYVGVIREMYENRTDEEEVWIVFEHEDGRIEGRLASSLSFEGNEDEVEDGLEELSFPVKVKRLSETAQLPAYANDFASGMDFYSDGDYIIPAGGTALVSTGVALELPAGFEMQLRSRSSMGKKGLILGNGVGTIDNDYRGEILFAFWNVSVGEARISKGDRIGQGVLSPVFRGTVKAVTELSETERGEGGFGSTGT